MSRRVRQRKWGRAFETKNPDACVGYIGIGWYDLWPLVGSQSMSSLINRCRGGVVNDAVC